MQKRTGVAEEILFYLINLPEDGDTLEGITDWWLRSDKGRHGVEEVKNALRSLIETGEIEEVRDSIEVTTFRIRKRIEI